MGIEFPHLQLLADAIEAAAVQWAFEALIAADMIAEDAGEEVKVWLPDMKFGHDFHNKINKMAIVGDKRWEKWLTALAKPFYADEAKFFHPEETDNAWTWLRETD